MLCDDNVIRIHIFQRYTSISTGTISNGHDDEVERSAGSLKLPNNQGPTHCGIDRTQLPTALSHRTSQFAAVTMVLIMTMRRSRLFVALLFATSCLVSVPARLLGDDGHELRGEDNKEVRERMMSERKHRVVDT
jgi:hypothetical protein